MIEKSVGVEIENVGNSSTRKLGWEQWQRWSRQDNITSILIC